MKMKPSERNAYKTQAKEAQREISQLETALRKLTPGTLPHKHVEAKLGDARAKFNSANANLSHSTLAK